MAEIGARRWVIADRYIPEWGSVQHTRLDSRQAANALASTIAYPVHEESP